ncbi:signal recognition particle-docking protein FtsY [Pleionea sp. CnH1-48]|uniref:signal recognition particle-docking protein FtsY n=1 Tax=Pleionea sp. CnH1-48 TaxID=2954494 RepID=UPI0020973206|nr:signal recognition particle-docking protein FtsY [Pleionea sp. CnH1-48]MCO7226534.1 signal recognition particle-docking protein FtsY [Pleionea sp. CnH1-48]
MSDSNDSNTKKKSGGLFGWFRRDKKPKAKPEAEKEIAPETEASQAEAEEVAPEPEIAEPEVQETTVIEPEVAPESEPAPTPEVETVQQEDEAESTEVAETEIAEEVVEVGDSPTEKPEEVQQKPGQSQGFFARLKSGLTKTRSNLAEGLASLVLGKKQIDDELLEDIETQLLTADLGVEATSAIIEELTQQTARNELKDSEALMQRLKQLLQEMVEPVAQPLTFSRDEHSPYVILMVGVNGVGKTTTIGKLAKHLKQQGLSVMLAAGDTFRAAAVEQLQVWGSRNDIHVVAQHEGADSASVIYDALASAKSKNVDVLIADTAGRLHTKSNLMDELTKVKRVMGKIDPTAPHEVMLVVDAGTGQNALNQAEQFDKAVGLTGITLTKLDGTAKGGVIFALARKFNIPIRFIGVGEGLDDLRPFFADEFIEALFSQESE